MKRKTIPERLDQVAERTPFPGLAREGYGQRPKPRRILPALLLMTAIIGMGVQIARPDALSVGAPSIVMLAFIGLTLLQLAGPLRAPLIDRPLDERKTRDHDRANMAGLGMVAVIAVGGAFLASFGNLLPGIWRPSTADDWRAVIFFLVATAIGTKMLYASWAMPRYELDDQEDES